MIYITTNITIHLHNDKITNRLYPVSGNIYALDILSVNTVGWVSFLGTYNDLTNLIEGLIVSKKELDKLERVDEYDRD